MGLLSLLAASHGSSASGGITRVSAGSVELWLYSRRCCTVNLGALPAVWSAQVLLGWLLAAVRQLDLKCLPGTMYSSLSRQTLHLRCTQQQQCLHTFAANVASHGGAALPYVPAAEGHTEKGCCSAAFCRSHRLPHHQIRRQRRMQQCGVHLRGEGAQDRCRCHGCVLSAEGYKVGPLQSAVAELAALCLCHNACSTHVSVGSCM
jgi:hypothetical protein